MCDSNQVKNAIETLAIVVAKADNVTDAILDIQEQVTAEVDVVKNASWFTVFTQAKYAAVQAKDEADARDRGQRKLNRLFPGQRNLIVGVCAGRLLRVEIPTAAPVPDATGVPTDLTGMEEAC